jgi:catechol 2,3-dioxygenase-like lactoylglutathione lyase family enzyme
MISHITVGVTDFERAYDFYRGLMAALDIEQRFCDRNTPWAGWQSAGGQRPLFLIRHPYDGETHQPGNGQMTAFLAKTRSMVRAAHAFALANGGQDEGAPGLRPHYHPHYYGTYFRDPDGNKLCVACHEAEQDETR